MICVCELCLLVNFLDLPVLGLIKQQYTLYLPFLRLVPITDSPLLLSLLTNKLLIVCGTNTQVSGE